MSHKRVVRVVSYEGNEDWVDGMLLRAHPGLNRTIFTKHGTIKCLRQIELGEGEHLKCETVR